MVKNYTIKCNKIAFKECNKIIFDFAKYELTSLF